MLPGVSVVIALEVYRNGDETFLVWQSDAFEAVSGYAELEAENWERGRKPLEATDGVCGAPPPLVPNASG
jgi:hypothetical protein